MTALQPTCKCLVKDLFSLKNDATAIYFVYNLPAGIWTSSFYLGNFVGPTLGGVLVDHYGFQTAGMVLFVAFSFNACMDIAQLIYDLLRSPQVLPITSSTAAISSNTRLSDEVLIS